MQGCPLLSMISRPFSDRSKAIQDWGWNPWFSEWPNDVNHYEIKLRGQDDLKQIIQKLVAIRCDVVRIRLDPGKEPGALGFTTVLPKGNDTAAVFAIGIIAAGVSSQFPNVLMLPWLLCDYNESERQMTLPRYRVMVAIISLLGLVVPIFHARPVYVMVLSQALQSVVLPLTVGCILYLGNRQDLMGEHKNKLPTNLVLIALLILSTVTTYMGITGVCQKIASLLGA